MLANFFKQIFSHIFQTDLFFFSFGKMQPILEASIKLRSKEKPVEQSGRFQLNLIVSSLMVYFLLLMTK